MTPAIAIVGMACRYPDANSPQELWENALAQRRAFRRIPPERLSLSDYFSEDLNTPDAIYSSQAALITNYEFDRVNFRTVGSTYRSADLTHWLALEVAANALADAGFKNGEGLPKETTGVLLGNTLTGEMSRANTLRLRWPYVRRTVANLLSQKGMNAEEKQSFLLELESQFKAPFTEIGEESLAGNLSNTIAGRICNYFDLKGGGYAVDGACSSSLLAIAQACSGLISGDLDVALAGGVDISIDPFELVGFAKVGALAPDEMRIYDQRSTGFIPGEGCGFVVLMPYETAIAERKPIYGVIRGWGISSDGHGGLTRPEVEGQRFAIQRAYRRAGFGIDSIGYFEGHGTGTVVGDATELAVLSSSRQNTEVNPENSQAVIGSIKANIGHTKAAAGIAGFIKATMALHHQILPPTTGCQTPAETLQQENAPLKILKKGQLWPEKLPLRAAVSAMGFGGINSHVVIEGASTIRRQALTTKEETLLSSYQDRELLLFSATTVEDLLQKIEHLLTFTSQLSLAEIGDLAAELAKNIDNKLSLRAAIITRNPQELTQQLKILKNYLENPHTQDLNQENIFISPPFQGGLGGIKSFKEGLETIKIGFLFPGQAAPVYPNGNLWEHRFPAIAALYQQTELPINEPLQSTLLAQLAIITASLTGLEILTQLGITAEVAVGHSLGELCALHWAGVYNQESLIKLAKMRGQIMANLGELTGTMASIGSDQKTVQTLIAAQNVVIAGLNSPQQTVISGAINAVNQVVEKAKNQGIKAIILPVSQAFHSPFMKDAITPFNDYLVKETFSPLQKSVISTVIGSDLKFDQNISSLLLQQLTDPVRFIEAVTIADKKIDLWIEVGSGQILNRLVKDFLTTPVISLDSSSNSLQGLFQIVARLFSLGIEINYPVVFSNRFHRPFDLNWQPKFFANPCELAPILAGDSELLRIQKPTELASIEAEKNVIVGNPFAKSATSKIDCVRHLVAQRTELPIAAIHDHHRLLSDLHLNSITVGQLVVEAARNLGLTPPISPTDYADASVSEIAQSLEDLTLVTDNPREEHFPAGVAHWIRPFTVQWVEEKTQDSRLKFEGSDWQIIDLVDNDLTRALSKIIKAWEGIGVIVCLPSNPTLNALESLLRSAKNCLQNPQSTHFVLIQNNHYAASFARTFFLENPQIITCVINLNFDDPQAKNWIETEVKTAQTFVEVTYDIHGVRRTPTLELLEIPFTSIAPNFQVNDNDLLLVTGGGKGIAAESALVLAKTTGVSLVLLGRSEPKNDPELARNLSRMTSAGIKVNYFSCDVTIPEKVAEIIQKIEIKLGKITAIIHGAGVNQPKLIRNLELTDFINTFAPKVNGLANLLNAIPHIQLKQLITFGSIIARTGLPGEADYALANDILGHLVSQFQGQNPHCHCVNIDWSVWSGTGMGERLGRIDSLVQQGITPLSPDQAIAVLRQLMSQVLPTTSVVVTGRFGNPPTLTLSHRELPLLRFLENPKVDYPGIELVVEAELSLATDPYLQDHVYQGEYIFPAVMGLEAIAEVAMALADTTEITQLENVQFNRPIVVSTDNPPTIRIAAITRETNQIEVVIRSEQTAFAIDHFRAICRLTSPASPSPRPSLSPSSRPNVDPPTHLYKELLFHQGRFQRLQSYHHLKAMECIAEIKTDTRTPWFSRYLPQDLKLGDAGARDAAIHALQACIPHATILPVGIEKLTIYQVNDQVNHQVTAIEREHDGDRFIYDLWVTTESGTILEVWQGLTLQIIQKKPPQSPWLAELLPAYLERCLRENIPSVNNSNFSLIFDQDGTVEPRIRSDRALAHLTATTELIRRRLDGKPDDINGQFVSVSHCQDLTLAITANTPLACDLEMITPRNPDLWRDLLGQETLALAQLLTRETNESFDTIATRLWAAKECLKKVGAMPNAALAFTQATEQVIWFQSGIVLEKQLNLAIATFVITLHNFDSPLVIALLIAKVKSG
ncbi:MAG: type I polyketide synthase [Woronichinia naegeliana WA131]|uniref:Type I polyketide synthase n=1 Tax=Woronichinia naegeliana WA131 TaxID=2824559 RepID=A0A977KZT9_9CYAN|nr:MAG: type I polyketide synthase [Woronichinia naegeliana WA131]